MSISMEQVAQQAGVSKSTVSLVLNNRPGVSDEMRQRVLESARAIGYELPEKRPRIRATDVQPTAPVIALVHCVDEEPDIDEGQTHLYLSYRNGIQRYTQGRDISVMLMTNYLDGQAENLSYQLLAHQTSVLDGLILMGPGLRRNSMLIQHVLEQQIPAVILGRSWPDLPISSVSQDHSEQANLILEHLLALGHRHIGFVAREIDQTYDWFHWRIKTYRDVAANKLHRDDDAYIVIDNHVASGVKNLLAEHPQITALLALNDHIAYQTMQAAIDSGRPVPEALSVAGIDGVISAQEGLPLLTTIAFPHEEVGYLAAETLLRQIENKNLLSAQLKVRSHLVMGASCRESK